MPKYDLTFRMVEFLDSHLVIPLFEFLAEQKIYPAKEVLKAKLDLLQLTKMADYLSETHEALYGTAAPEFAAHRATVMDEFRCMQDRIDPVIVILDDPNVEQMMKNSNCDSRQLVDYIVENHEFHPDMLDTLFKYAKFQFECGNYGVAGACLNSFRTLVPQHHPNYLNALWGRLACSILDQNSVSARDDLVRLKTFIDNDPFDSELTLLQQRAWFIHWSLFVNFHYAKGRDEIIDMFLNNYAYLNPIQILCPHILRYLTAAVILNKRRQTCVKELVRIIELEAYQYRDPLTEFIECLYITYDFERAQVKLQECEEVASKDFFLVACMKDFIDAARMLNFEIYCRVHRCVSLSSVAVKLGTDADKTEKWIVNLIRNARLDAKLDALKVSTVFFFNLDFKYYLHLFKQGHIIMGNRQPNVYESVMENTRILSFRAQSLAYQLEKNALEDGNKEENNFDANSRRNSVHD
ncbi:Eukaryotic translation initiation factor 3 subunit E [Trichinella nativa]|uniref:Eukaryotic translation initiation factor 3 subunit E n=2 Tax=Trichinella TaxID=6333 RepID=A0A0V1L443_9BILA|nr:Eukaryotic translation initiation factor 3 subunit E [Trichinella murrelli]KRZ54060.1 Eukaryotic translation initiation factor 3 subunit E [Trichinella nativa]